MTIDRQVIDTALLGAYDFVKTSTGFSTGGATTADVKLMADTVGDALEVKASGGIPLEMIANGASRIGASASVAIMQED